MVKFCVCKLFADDTKLLARIRNESDALRLQQDLDSVIRWAETWLMRFNLGKCKVMHFGSGNGRAVYSMYDKTENRRIELEKTDTERDLGVVVSSDAKWHKHVSTISAKASSMLGWLKKAFRSRDPYMWKKLYTTYVRSAFEFAEPVWNPSSLGDISMLERIQHRATKISHVMKGLSYAERLKKLNLMTLENRRVRGDCIQMYKIGKGIEKVNLQSNPRNIPESDRPRRVGNGQLRREIVKNCSQRYNYFTNRIVGKWNGLPEETVEANSVNSFKAKYDKFVANNL